MKIIRTLHNYPVEARGLTLLVGKFDAIHLGHQHLLQRAQSFKNKVGLLTFEPNPVKYFKPELVSNQVLSFSQRAKHLRSMGLDYLIIQRFNQAFAEMSAVDFVEQLLVARMNIVALVVGEDFAFGAKRLGDLALLRRYKSDFELHVSDMRGENGLQYSTSIIREKIQDGNLKNASLLLGYAYYIEGRVIAGKKIGRELGFPTANMKIDGLVCPPFGVYLVKVYIAESNNFRYGIANLGIRPSFAENDPLLEVHILNFAGDIYGKKLRVEILDFLREQRKFPNIDELKKQIELDVRTANQIIANNYPSFSARSDK